MLIVEQRLVCDACSAEIERSTQNVPPNVHVSQVMRPVSGAGSWKDLCVSCFGDMLDAFWTLRRERE